MTFIFDKREGEGGNSSTPRLLFFVFFLSLKNILKIMLEIKL